jgi:hypothetical protein
LDSKELQEVVNVGNFDKKLGVSIELKLGLTDMLTNLTQYEKYCKTLENYTSIE